MVRNRRWNIGGLKFYEHLLFQTVRFFSQSCLVVFDDCFRLVLSADAAGAMYGGFDLAEAIRLGTLAELKDADHSPHIAARGIKFNIPLDARTPSYSGNSDSAQNSIPEMWSLDFWREMLSDGA